MKAKAFARAGAITAACAVIIAGLSSAPAAMADPVLPPAGPAVTSTTLAGFGSDTTQDVMNALTKKINTDNSASWMASYDALGSNTVVAKPGGVAIPRGNGSGEGKKLLQVAKGLLGSAAIVSGTSKTTLTVTNGEAAGQVDFARSSSNGAANSTGVLSYVPFAKDAVTVATNPLGTGATLDPAAALSGNVKVGTASEAATVASLWNIYHCVTRYVYTTAAGVYVGVGAAATPLPPTATTATLLKPLLPAFGSGTRKYFVEKVVGGYTDSASLIDPTNVNTSCLSDKYAGQGINEHDGTAIKGTGKGALAPFSIPQWVAQSRSATTPVPVTDRRNSVVLASLLNTAVPAVAIAPTTGSPAVTNTAFIVTRSVYNVVPYGKVSVEGTQEYKIFNGATSEICKNPDTIAAMGFIPLATATPAGSSNCGYIENRDGDAVVKVTATVSAEFAQVKAGVDESVDITLDSNPFAGAGSALFYGSGDSYASALNADPVAIDAGDYRGTYTATVNAAAGTTVSFKGKFTPTDTSVVSASDKSAAVNVKAVNAYTVTLNDIPSRVATGAAVPVTATVAAGTGGALVGGTISLVDGNGAVLAEKYLPKRATKADFSWTAVAGTTNLAVVFEPDNSSLGLVATSDAQDVYASAAVTKATVTTVATTPVVWGTKTGYFGKVSITSTGVPTIKVALAAAGTLKPTGTVKVLISTSKTGGTALTLAPATVAADGTVTVTLPKVNKWRVTGATSGGLDRYLNVVYSGDTNFYGNTTSLKISVTT